MSSPAIIAAGVVAVPRRLSTVANRDLLAICQALIEAEGRPQISNELAAAARALFEMEAAHTLAKGADGYAPLKVGLAREMAFHTFKITFEEEFPN